jgi:butyryl-CoA dehydrogenase
MAATNPLFADREAAFVLFEVLAADKLCALPHFADHSRETFELYVRAAAKLAREVVLPTYKPMDEDAPRFEGGRVHSHPCMNELYPQLVELGVLSASRPAEVDGQQLPLCVASMAAAYVMAANLSAFGYCMLTSGAAHLIEAFGSDALKADFMRPMYAGRFTGTMALTEPQAGSSLGDLSTRARRTSAGHYLIDGSKVFISGADQTFSENVVHLVLARIEGAPAGSAGISLFAVPKLRRDAEKWIDNDVHVAGAFHKLGWRGIASTALNFGEGGDCHGYLVGEAQRGLRYMFQMMNEARINIGLHGVATASIAYHQALGYARERSQGRPQGHDPQQPPVAIIEHADVRRMLLRQKAIVEGGLALVLATARYQDVALHGSDEALRARSQRLLDLLTPIAKTFPAERGFEANTLALQVHGGYGYTSEYLPEAWLRDQKLNSIHEGTTGIQALDLLGRKVLRDGPTSIDVLFDEMISSANRALSSGLSPSYSIELERSLGSVTGATRALCARAERDLQSALSHASDYMEMMSIVVVAWQWLVAAGAASAGLNASPSSSGSALAPALRGGASSADRAFYRGKLQAARYFFRVELPRVTLLAAACASCEDGYEAMRDEWF